MTSEASFSDDLSSVKFWISPSVEARDMVSVKVSGTEAEFDETVVISPINFNPVESKK